LLLRLFRCRRIADSFSVLLSLDLGRIKQLRLAEEVSNLSERLSFFVFLLMLILYDDYIDIIIVDNYKKCKK